MASSTGGMGGPKVPDEINDIYLRWLTYADKNGGERAAIEKLNDTEQKVVTIAINALKQSFKTPPKMEGEEIIRAYQGDTIEKLKAKLGSEKAVVTNLPQRVDKSWQDIYPIRIIQQHYTYIPEHDAQFATLNEHLMKGQIQTFGQFLNAWQQWRGTLVGETRKIAEDTFADLFAKDLDRWLENADQPLTQSEKVMLITKLSSVKTRLEIFISNQLSRGLSKADESAIKKAGIGKSELTKKETKERIRLNEKVWDDANYILFPVKKVLEQAVVNQATGTPLSHREKLVISLLNTLERNNNSKTNNLIFKILRILHERRVDEAVSADLKARLPSKYENVQEAFEKLLARITEDDRSLQEGDIGLFFEILRETDLSHDEEGVRFLIALSGNYEIAEESLETALGAYRLIGDGMLTDYLSLETIYIPHIRDIHEAGQFSKVVTDQAAVQKRVLEIEMVRFAKKQVEFEYYLERNGGSVLEASRELVSDTIENEQHGFESLPTYLKEAFHKFEALEKRSMIWAKYGTDLGSGAAAVSFARYYTRYADWGRDRWINPITKLPLEDKDLDPVSKLPKRDLVIEGKAVQVGMKASFRNALNALEKARKLGAPEANGAIAELLVQRYGAEKRIYHKLNRQLDAVNDQIGLDSDREELVKLRNSLTAQMEEVGKNVAELRKFTVDFCIKKNIPRLHDLALHGSIEAGVEMVKKLEYMYYKSPWRFAAPEPSLVDIQVLTTLALMDVDGAKDLLSRLWKSYPKSIDLSLAHQLVKQGTIGDAGRGFTSEVALECIHMAASGLHNLAREPLVPDLEHRYKQSGGNFGDLKDIGDPDQGYFYQTYVAKLKNNLGGAQASTLEHDGEKVMSAHRKLARRFPPVDYSKVSQPPTPVESRTSSQDSQLTASSDSSSTLGTGDAYPVNGRMTEELDTVVTSGIAAEPVEAPKPGASILLGEEPDIHSLASLADGTVTADGAAEKSLTPRFWDHLASFWNFISTPFRAKPDLVFGTERLKAIGEQELLHNVNSVVIEAIGRGDWNSLVVELRRRDPNRAQQFYELVKEISTSPNRINPQMLARQLRLHLFGEHEHDLQNPSLMPSNLQNIVEKAIDRINNAKISLRIKEGLKAELEALYFGKVLIVNRSEIFLVVNKLLNDNSLANDLTNILWSPSYTELTQKIIEGRAGIIKAFEKPAVEVGMEDYEAPALASSGSQQLLQDGVTPPGPEEDLADGLDLEALTSFAGRAAGGPDLLGDEKLVLRSTNPEIPVTAVENLDQRSVIDRFLLTPRHVTELLKKFAPGIASEESATALGLAASNQRTLLEAEGKIQDAINKAMAVHYNSHYQVDIDKIVAEHLQAHPGDDPEKIRVEAKNIVDKKMETVRKDVERLQRKDFSKNRKFSADPTYLRKLLALPEKLYGAANKHLKKSEKVEALLVLQMARIALNEIRRVSKDPNVAKKVQQEWERKYALTVATSLLLGVDELLRPPENQLVPIRDEAKIERAKGILYETKAILDELSGPKAEELRKNWNLRYIKLDEIFLSGIEKKSQNVEVKPSPHLQGVFDRYKAAIPKVQEFIKLGDKLVEEATKQGKIRNVFGIESQDPAEAEKLRAEAGRYGSFKGLFGEGAYSLFDTLLDIPAEMRPLATVQAISDDQIAEGKFPKPKNYSAVSAINEAINTEKVHLETLYGGYQMLSSLRNEVKEEDKALLETLLEGYQRMIELHEGFFKLLTPEPIPSEGYPPAQALENIALAFQSPLFKEMVEFDARMSKLNNFAQSALGKYPLSEAVKQKLLPDRKTNQIGTASLFDRLITVTQRPPRYRSLVETLIKEVRDSDIANPKVKGDLNTSLDIIKSSVSDFNAYEGRF
jgi:hypothetical protein